MVNGQIRIIEINLSSDSDLEFNNDDDGAMDDPDTWDVALEGEIEDTRELVAQDSPLKQRKAHSKKMGRPGGDIVK